MSKVMVIFLLTTISQGCVAGAQSVSCYINSQNNLDCDPPGSFRIGTNLHCQHTSGSPSYNCYVNSEGAFSCLPQIPFNFQQRYKYLFSCKSVPIPTSTTVTTPHDKDAPTPTTLPHTTNGSKTDNITVVPIKVVPTNVSNMGNKTVVPWLPPWISDKSSKLWWLFMVLIIFPLLGGGYYGIRRHYRSDSVTSRRYQAAHLADPTDTMKSWVPPTMKSETQQNTVLSSPILPPSILQITREKLGRLKK